MRTDCVFLRALLSVLSPALVVLASSQSGGFLLSRPKVGYFMDHCPRLSTAFGGMGVLTHPLLLLPRGVVNTLPPSCLPQKSSSPLFPFLQVQLGSL